LLTIKHTKANTYITVATKPIQKYICSICYIGIRTSIRVSLSILMAIFQVNLG